MDPAIYLEALRRDGAALSRAARGAPDAPVPTCPGWSMADLVAHVGQVHRDKAGIARAGAVRQRPPRAADPTQTGDALLAWYDEGLVDLVAVLAAADPEQPAWSWSRHPADARIAFWLRRMAHETAVHRWDAEHAAGVTVAAIDPPSLAADGVDEVLDLWMGGPGDPPYTGAAGTVHLHASDTPGEWVLRLGGQGGVEVRRGPAAGAADAGPAAGAADPGHDAVDASGHDAVDASGHAHADVALRGAASDLDLVLWGRLPAGGLAPRGDAMLLDGFLGWLGGN